MKQKYRKGQRVIYHFSNCGKTPRKRIGVILKVCPKYKSVPAHYHIEGTPNFVLPEEIILVVR